MMTLRNALREFLNPESADSEKLCQERATEILLEVLSENIEFV